MIIRQRYMIGFAFPKYISLFINLFIFYLNVFVFNQIVRTFGA